MLNIFNALFWKTKTFFKKLEHRSLVVSTKIENASFPYKTVISEANVNTKRMESSKRSSANNYFDFFFSKILFQLKNLSKELVWRSNDPSVHIHSFGKRWSFLCWCFFSLSILNYVYMKKIYLILHCIIKMDLKQLFAYGFYQLSLVFPVQITRAMHVLHLVPW